MSGSTPAHAAVVLAACLACSRSSPPAAPAPAAPPAAVAGANRPMRWPVRAEWVVKARAVKGARTREELEARIQLEQPITAPISVALEPLEGVELQAGRARFSLPAGITGHVEAYTIERTQLPGQNLRLLVDAEGQGFGVHLRVPYDFGRPAAPPSAAPRGSNLVVGGRSLGPSVRVGSK